jgi:predicted nuclease of predicted toxin-antitoxin system
VKLLADENLDNDILRGLLRRRPALDILRVQDVGFSGADDPTVLAWAAGEGRIVLTHDAATMVRYAYARVDRGEAMPGVVIISQSLAIAAVIEEVLLLVDASSEGEWAGRVVFLPL